MPQDKTRIIDIVDSTVRGAEERLVPRRLGLRQREPMGARMAVFVLMTLALCCAAAAQGLLQNVRLNVHDYSGLGREGEVVVSGVPVPESAALYDAANLRVVDSAGAAVPARISVTGRWRTRPEDVAGRVRWLLVEFPATVSPSATATYWLRHDGPPPATTGIIVSETADRIDVTTGPARFRVGKTAFTLFDQVWLDLNGDGAFGTNEQLIAPWAAAGSRVFRGAVEFDSSRRVPRSVLVEETGPLRAVIRVEGFHQNAFGATLLRYVTRLFFSTGQSHVRVQHTIIEGRVLGSGNSDLPNQQMTAVDRAALSLRAAFSGPLTVRVNGSLTVPVSRPLPPGGTASVRQHSLTDWRIPMAYEVQVGGEISEQGRKATRAWLDVRDSRFGVAVSTRRFWEKNPQRLAADGSGQVDVEFPSEPTTIYQAMGLMEDATFYFHPASTPLDSLRRTLEGTAKDPLFAVAPPARYVDSGALGEIPRYPAPAAYARFDTVLGDHRTATNAWIVEGHAYGLMDYLCMPIDRWNGEPDPDQVSWGDSYYDAPGAEIREFARRGDFRLLRDLAFPQIQHWYTTDAYDTDNAGWYQNGISGARGACHRESWTAEYHYMESLWDYYYLTGDARARERGYRAALSYIRNPLWANDADYGSGPGLTTRVISQKLHTMLQAYLAVPGSGLRASVIAQTEDALAHVMTPEGFVVAARNRPNPYNTDQGWMTLLLLHDTIYKYYRLTGSPAARNFVITVPQRIEANHRISRDPSSPDYLRFYNLVRVTVSANGSFTTAPYLPFGNSDDYFYDGGVQGLVTALCRAASVSGNGALRAQAADMFGRRVLPAWVGTVWDKPAAQQTLRAHAGLYYLSLP